MRVQRSWPGANSALIGGSVSRDVSRPVPSAAIVSGGTRPPLRAIMPLTTSTPAQMPARALRQADVHQQRHDTEREAARQRYQAEAFRITGENKADKRQQRKSARQHDFVNRAEGTAVLGRHQFGGDRKRRRHGKSRAESGQQAY